tara:strand:- start:1086 stop:1646 length:561 start_codon:yes stop_codon:yes gene_type:complete
MNKRKKESISRNLQIAEKIGNRLLMMSDINFFRNTRQREYVDIRSLMVHILYNKVKMPWVRIAEYFEENGKKMDHATAMYLEKAYEENRDRNPRLIEYENSFKFEKTIYLPTEDTTDEEQIYKMYLDLKKEYETLKTNCVGYAKSAIKDKFVNDFFIGIPAEKFDEVMKKITQLKKSWEWKEALKQ